VAKNELRMDGLDELRRQLRTLPAELREEAQDIVRDAADTSAAAIKEKYPRRTGNLKNGVKVKRLGGSGAIAGAQVINTAPHAALFESGTQARHNQLGANRGAMPPGRVFIPIVVRNRRRMYQRLMAMLQRQGFQVSGDAG